MAPWKQRQRRSIPGDETQCFLSSGRIFPSMRHNVSLYRRENEDSEEQVRPASRERKDSNVLITAVIAVFYQRWPHTWNICLTFLRGRLTFSLCISWWISSMFSKPSPFLSASSKVCFTHVQKGQRKVSIEIRTALPLNATGTQSATRNQEKCSGGDPVTHRLCWALEMQQ